MKKRVVARVLRPVLLFVPCSVEFDGFAEKRKRSGTQKKLVYTCALEIKKSGELPILTEQTEQYKNI